MLGNIRASSIGVVCMGFSHGYGKVPSEEYFECRDLYQIIRRHLGAFEKVKAGRQDGMEKAVTIRRVKMGMRIFSPIYRLKAGKRHFGTLYRKRSFWNVHK